MAHPRGKQQFYEINDKRRLTGTLSLSLFCAVPALMANPDRPPPDAKENLGTAATGPGFDTKSELAIGRKTLSLSWGAAQ